MSVIRWEVSSMILTLTRVLPGMRTKASLDSLGGEQLLEDAGVVATEEARDGDTKTEVGKKGSDIHSLCRQDRIASRRPG
jgi:hypothetical protein